MVRLDIFSDPVCPWCYIGKAQLDRALEARPDHPFLVEWHPFQLNPGMPREGVDRRDYLAAKFGGAGRADAQSARVEAAAREAGVEIDFARVPRVPNTLDAHRLIHWAGIEGRQAAVVSALFRAYFREGRDIGNRVELARIAGACGMDELAVAIALAGENDRDDLAARDADAQRKGVTSVPTYLIDRQYVVQGAQPPDLWMQVIDDITAQLDAAADGVAPTARA
jgi:predicted DsbA family dithiol-disulfide isomerase